jgi:thiaminase
MKKEEIANHFKALGFDLEELPDYAYMTQYEGMTMLYLFDDDDDEFFRMAAPKIFDVTEENRESLLDIANEINIKLKYSKTTVLDDAVWVSYEHHFLDEEHIDAIIEHAMMLLQATVYAFHRRVNGDELNPSQDDDTDDEE